METVILGGIGRQIDGDSDTGWNKKTDTWRM